MGGLSRALPGSTPVAIVSAINDAIVRDGGQKFIIQGFPASLDAAFHFEKTIAQPLFVLLDGGVVGPVADLYMKIGVARVVTGKGDAAFESAAKHFRPQLAFVLGRPGSGKTSACGVLRDALGYVPLRCVCVCCGHVCCFPRRGCRVVFWMGVWCERES